MTKKESSIRHQSTCSPADCDDEACDDKITMTLEDFFKDRKTEKIPFLRDIETMLYIFREKFNEYHLLWKDDFFSFERMSIPRKSELFARVNLNVPYYFLNYALLMIIVTFSTLVLINIPYFLTLLANAIGFFRMFYASFISPIKGKKNRIKIFQWYPPFSYIGHFLVLLWIGVLFFADGFRAGFIVIFLNCIVVFPHALLRNPTVFDDEEMEKLRPKLLDYLLSAAFVLLSYLEGDTGGAEDENRRRAREERERIDAILFKKNLNESIPEKMC